MKMKATGKKLAAKAICHAKAYKLNLPADSACLAKAEAKFAASFAKADAKGGCATIDNAAAVEAEVDVCIAGLAPDLAPSCGDAAGPGGTDLACSCGDTVVTDTTLDLSFDPVATTTCIVDGLRLAAGVQLDLNGLVLSGSNTGNGLSVPSGGTVSGGTVRNFGVGVRVGPGAAASLVTVASTIIEENAGQGAVIEVTDSQSRVVFDGVTVQGNGGHGIHVRAAPGASNLDADEVLAESDHGFVLRNASIVHDNAGDGVHLGDPAQPADVAARIGDGLASQDIHTNLGAGILMEQKTGVAPGADCGASGGQPGCTGASIVNSIMRENGGAGVELRSGFIIPFDSSGLGFLLNLIRHNAMPSVGCTGSQSVAQIFVTGPVGLGNATCGGAATEPDCANLSVAGNNRHCVWTAAATCVVAWELRGALTTGSCGLANKIQGYSNGAGENDVGLRAVGSSAVDARNNYWVGSPEVTLGGGSTIDVSTTCGGLGCGSP